MNRLPTLADLDQAAVEQAHNAECHRLYQPAPYPENTPAHHARSFRSTLDYAIRMLSRYLAGEISEQHLAETVGSLRADSEIIQIQFQNALERAARHTLTQRGIAAE